MQLQSNESMKAKGFTFMNKASERSERGFTLIEILIVMTIIGILFGVGYASYRDFSRRQTLIGIAKQIQGDLRLAQQMSLSGEKTEACNGKELSGIGFGITKGTAPPYYRIRIICGYDAAGNYPIFKTYSLPLGFTYNESTFSPNPILFKVLGQGTNIPSGQTATLTIQDPFGNAATVTIDSGGSIK